MSYAVSSAEIDYLTRRSNGANTNAGATSAEDFEPGFFDVAARVASAAIASTSQEEPAQ